MKRCPFLTTDCPGDCRAHWAAVFEEHLSRHAEERDLYPGDTQRDPDARTVTVSYEPAPQTALDL